MLLITPFNAVTKLPIAVCAAEVSGLTVRVVGVAGAEAAVKSRVTPLMALLTTLLALAAAKSVDRKTRIQCAACVSVRWGQIERAGRHHHRTATP